MYLEKKRKQKVFRKAIHNVDNLSIYGLKRGF